MGVLLNLGPLGQMPNVDTYTLLTLGFPVQARSQEHVLSTLEKAANKITTAFPWLEGQVVREGSSEASSGKYNVIDYELHQGKMKFIHVKDCTHLCPAFESIVERKAPVSMLDGSIISPAYGFPYFYPENVVKPVVIMQANFIQGGLLLTICTHHCVMDANGNEHFTRQFASLCRGEQLSDEDIHFGNGDQSTIIQPLKQGEEPHSLEMLRVQSALGKPPGVWPPPPSSGFWKVFQFSKANILALKAQAGELCSAKSDVPYISSNDAVTAFIWKRIATLRSASLPQESKTTLVRAVNMRQRVQPPIPTSYMGHTILCTYATLPLETVVKEPLSVSAIAIRRSLADANDHHFRSFFQMLKNEQDKTKINYGAKMNPETDIMITSFVAQRLYATDFGNHLGLPAFVRRPMLPDAPGLLYLMPATRDGDIALIAAMSDDEFHKLMKDEKWTEFTELIT